MEAYLDNSATTRCSDAAADAMLRLLKIEYGNPSSMHGKGLEAERAVTKAAGRIAATLKVQPKEILFTSGGTESNNLAIIGGALANRRAGKHLITTRIEHPSVRNAMEFLKEQGFEVTELSVDANGIISLQELREALREDTILVSIMQVNNEIGAVEPVAEAGALIKEYRSSILFHVDAIQSYGKLRIRPGKDHIDLLSVSGHKIHGPKGIGFLYVRDKTKLMPLIYGGGQQRGLRSGTENVPAIAALGVAAEESERDRAEKTERMYVLKECFVRRVSRIEGVSVNGVFAEDTEARLSEHVRRTAPHIVSVSIEGIRAEVMLHALEERGIYVSAGSACSSNKPAVSRTLLGVGLRRELLDATIRFSFSVETTPEETEYAVEVMEELIPGLRRYTRR